MATDINKASVKQLTTLPGIGAKFAEIVVSIRSKKGNVIIDDFKEFPALQTKLNELNEKGLILIDYIANLSSDLPTNGSGNTDLPTKQMESKDPIYPLIKQVGELGKIMQENTLAITGAISDHKIQSQQSEIHLANLI